MVGEPGLKEFGTAGRQNFINYLGSQIPWRASTKLQPPPATNIRMINTHDYGGGFNLKKLLVPEVGSEGKVSSRTRVGQGHPRQRLNARPEEEGSSARCALERGVPPNISPE